MRMVLDFPLLPPAADIDLGMTTNRSGEATETPKEVAETED